MGKKTFLLRVEEDRGVQVGNHLDTYVRKFARYPKIFFPENDLKRYLSRRRNHYPPKEEVKGEDFTFRVFLSWEQRVEEKKSSMI